MYENAVLENVFGTIGTVLWCVQIIPQIVVNYRRKDVEGLSIWLMFIWSVASIFLGVYCVAQNLNVPLIVQPQLFGSLAAVCWVQCLYYGPRKLSRNRSLILLGAYLALFAGLEVAFVYAVRAGTDAGTDAPLLLFGIICAVLLLGGLGPQYYEIWRFNEVVGLSLVFMTMDLMGGVFCTMSLAFKAEFDILASVNYIGIVVLDGGILILAAILNPRAKRRRARLAAELVGASSPMPGPAATGDGDVRRVASALEPDAPAGAREWDVEELAGRETAVGSRSPSREEKAALELDDEKRQGAAA